MQEEAPTFSIWHFIPQDQLADFVQQQSPREVQNGLARGEAGDIVLSELWREAEATNSFARLLLAFSEWRHCVSRCARRRGQSRERGTRDFKQDALQDPRHGLSPARKSEHDAAPEMTENRTEEQRESHRVSLMPDACVRFSRTGDHQVHVRGTQECFKVREVEEEKANYLRVSTDI
jgi:hypothetical protein